MILLTLNEALEARATHRFWRDSDFRLNIIETIRYWLSQH